MIVCPATATVADDGEGGAGKWTAVSASVSVSDVTTAMAPAVTGELLAVDDVATAAPPPPPVPPTGEGLTLTSGELVLGPCK